VEGWTEFARAIRPAHDGAARLVPPMFLAQKDDDSERLLDWEKSK
jgi:hypothetical protein